MRPETTAWVGKAEGDFTTAAREAIVTQLANYDAVCFHAQQCVEKYLKALLVEANIGFPKTHDLLALCTLAEAPYPAITGLRSVLAQLAPYSVTIRYPGDQATVTDASSAIAACIRIRETLRQELQLPL